MIITATEKFKNNLKILTEFEIKMLVAIYDEIETSNSISAINSSSLVGFPHLHTIDLGKYVVGAQIKNNEIELAGIVEKGKEYTLFF